MSSLTLHEPDQRSRRSAVSEVRGLGGQLVPSDSRVSLDPLEPHLWSSPDLFYRTVNYLPVVWMSSVANPTSFNDLDC